MDYPTIKREARARGCRVTDLIVLAAKNDPFYSGQPAEVRNAEWFAQVWERFGGPGVHLRRLHYRAQAPNDLQLPAVLTWKDKDTKRQHTTDIYLNNDRCWNFLEEASKHARYLELVPAADFVDRKHPEPVIYASWNDGWAAISPRYGVAGGGAWDWITVPALPGLEDLYRLPDWPTMTSQGWLGIEQDYHVEVWIEKSTMNDELLPLCSRYNVNLVTAEGELSVTAVLAFLDRAVAADRPARILYVSDFDPAGLNMPISVARKVEFYQRKHDLAHLDIRLDPVILTAEQVIKYDLPRVPVKDSDPRKGNFEDVHGEGQVELDALAALHPGEFEAIIEAAILNYYDPDLPARVREEGDRLAAEVESEEDRAIAKYSDRIEVLNADYAALQERYRGTRRRFDEQVASFQPELDAYEAPLEELRQRGEKLYSEIYDELRKVFIDLGDYPRPVPCLPPETDGKLYVSGRSYWEQLAYYKAHQQAREPGDLLAELGV